MEIKFVNPETNQEVVFDAGKVNFEEAMNQLNPVVSQAKLKKEIDNLPFEKADVKLLLDQISKKTEKIGNYTIKVGHKAVELAISFVKRYPNTSAGLIIGAVTGFIISSIPIIGWLIGWLVMPLCTALGLGIGAYLDIQDKQLQGRIKDEVMDIFGSLSAAKAAA